LLPFICKCGVENVYIRFSKSDFLLASNALNREISDCLMQELPKIFTKRPIKLNFWLNLKEERVDLNWAYYLTARHNIFTQSEYDFSILSWILLENHRICQSHLL
jgi:hypothetical protein